MVSDTPIISADISPDSRYLSLLFKDSIVVMEFGSFEIKFSDQRETNYKSLSFLTSHSVIISNDSSLYRWDFEKAQIPIGIYRFNYSSYWKSSNTGKYILVYDRKKLILLNDDGKIVKQLTDQTSHIQMGNFFFSSSDHFIFSPNPLGYQKWTLTYKLSHVDSLFYMRPHSVYDNGRIMVYFDDHNRLITCKAWNGETVKTIEIPRSTVIQLKASENGKYFFFRSFDSIHVYSDSLSKFIFSWPVSIMGSDLDTYQISPDFRTVALFKYPSKLYLINVTKSSITDSLTINQQFSPPMAFLNNDKIVFGSSSSNFLLNVNLKKKTEILKWYSGLLLWVNGISSGRYIIACNLGNSATLLDQNLDPVQTLYNVESHSNPEPYISKDEKKIFFPGQDEIIVYDTYYGILQDQLDTMSLEDMLRYDIPGLFEKVLQSNVVENKVRAIWHFIKEYLETDNEICRKRANELVKSMLNYFKTKKYASWEWELVVSNLILIVKNYTEIDEHFRNLNHDIDPRNQLIINEYEGLIKDFEKFKRGIKNQLN
ncbi:MAG TPA: hypothetical protein VKB95_03280 [Chitinophagaceae bacterium]|nr:hypothetical protein [Chitinophagaceae bacterium]